MLDAVAAHDGRFGFRKLSEHLVGSRAQGMSGRLSHGATYGALSGRTRVVVEGWLHDAHDRGLLSLVPRRLAGDRTVHLLRLTPAGLRAVRSRQLADADA